MLSRVWLAAAVCAAQAQSWDANLIVEKVPGGTHAGTTYDSASSIALRWQAPEAAVHHYRIEAEEPRFTVRAQAAGDATAFTLTGLKSATAYTIRLRACLEEGCENYLDAPVEASITTPNEYWRIAGTGRGYATARRLVEDGNIGSHAFRYGPWAGPEKDGAVQLYYTPLPREEKGAKLARQTQRTEDAIESALAFTGISGYGLMRACGELPVGPNAPPPPSECVNPQGLVTGVSLYQAVPLAPDTEGNGRIRMFIEGPGRGGRQRIAYLDSQDGYEGRDFHRGGATRCDTAADYGPGGGCEPTLAIGVDIDGADGNPNLLNVRQFKIAWPTADSSAWDQAPGTFMWFTTEWRDGRCSTFGFNAAYAVWNGEKWEVRYGDNGCPKVLGGVQAPMPVQVAHAAGAPRYKLYFSRHSSTGGPTDPRVAIKPLEVLYGDPERSGEEGLTDFEDWEAVEDARNVHFLWPDGALLTEDEESRLDDFVVFTPGADPSQLVMYSNMSATGVTAVPFIGAAVLVNP